MPIIINSQSLPQQQVCIKEESLESPCLESPCLESRCLESPCLESPCLESPCLEKENITLNIEETEPENNNIDIIEDFDDEDIQESTDTEIVADTDNDVVDEKPTQAAEDDLLNRVKKFVSLPIYVENRLAGIRPAVQDRRPIIGTHPNFPQLSIINGMGSKAVLLAPLLSEILINHIENGLPIPVEVAINRFPTP